MEKKRCSCKWIQCERYGNCYECIEHHKAHPKHPEPFCKKKKSRKEKEGKS